MNDVKSFAKITAVFPIIWAISFSIILLAGALSFGHMPIFGADTDPESINSTSLNIIQWINIFSMGLGFIAVPAWLLLMAHLLINKVSLKINELILHLAVILSIGVFFLMRQVWVSQFLWVAD